MRQGKSCCTSLAASSCCFQVSQSEQKILLRAIFDTLVPKLVAQDKPLMQSLISGVFPGADVGIVDNQILQDEPRA